jgi:hypothetical protein
LAAFAIVVRREDKHAAVPARVTLCRIGARRGLGLAGPDLHCSEGEPVLTCCLGTEPNTLASRQPPISISGDRREVNPTSARNIGPVDDTLTFVGIEKPY